MLYNNRIQQISILGSSICNLSCSYCYLHNQDTKSFYNLLNEEIQTSWKNGNYVNNIKEVYQKINADPLLTTRMEIWGGEPLIQINNLLISISELYKFLPNVDFLMIPTNFAWPEFITEKIPELILLFDQSRNKEKNEFHLQLSIDAFDGPLLTEGHHANNKQYLKNFEVLIKELSKIKLNKTDVIIDIHGTASGKNILKYLSTEENLNKYIKDMFYLKEYTDNLIKKYNTTNTIIYGEFGFFPLCAVPENSTYDESLQYPNIMRLAEYISYKEKYLTDVFEHYCYQFDHNQYSHSIFQANHQCSESGKFGIMVLPDGTISECACTYVQNRPEYLELLLKNKQYDDYRTAVMRKNYFFNPLTATLKEESFNDWYQLEGLRDTYSTQLSLAMSMCQELVLSHQISWEYIDPELLLKHLVKETTPYSCPREQISDTGIAYIGHPGDYRRAFNGLLTYTANINTADKKIKIRNWLHDSPK